jgi:hypothetical protein
LVPWQCKSELKVWLLTRSVVDESATTENEGKEQACTTACNHLRQLVLRPPDSAARSFDTKVGSMGRHASGATITNAPGAYTPASLAIYVYCIPGLSHP